MRVAHLVSHPIQYFAPLYRELAARPSLRLEVFFYSDASLRTVYDAQFGREIEWDTPLLGGYESRILPSATRLPIPDSGPLHRPNWDVLRAILRGRYDAVWLHGYAYSTAILGVAAARAGGAKVFIREEQTCLHERSADRAIAKQALLRPLFAASHGLYIGNQSRCHFERYGMPADRLFFAPYCVDNRFFREREAELRPQRDALRERFGVAGPEPVIVFTGKLMDKKQPLLLIEAFERVRRERPCKLLMVGDGPLREAAEALVRDRAIPDVVMPGFLNQTELPGAYVASDVFCLPSKIHETWGLVVNEAMNFGLPVVVSDKVGSAYDLVHDRGTGFVAPHDSAEGLAQALGRLVDDPELRRQCGERGSTVVEEYSIERCADGLERAFTSVTHDGRAEEPARPS